MTPGLRPRCAGAGRILLLALLLGAVPASAQTRAPGRAAGKAPSASDIPLPPPPPGMTLRERPASPAWTAGVSIGPMFSLDSKAAATSFGLRLEASRPLKPLSPAVELQLFIPFTVAYWGRTDSLTIPGILPMFGTVEAKALWFAAVPSARFAFRLPGAPRLGLYADGGLGLAASFGKTTTDVIYQGRTVNGDTGVAAVIRLAAGGSYAMNDRLRLTFEPFGFDFHIGSGASTLSVLVGAAWRL